MSIKVKFSVLFLSVVFIVSVGIRVFSDNANQQLSRDKVLSDSQELKSAELDSVYFSPSESNSNNRQERLFEKDLYPAELTLGTNTIETTYDTVSVESDVSNSGLSNSIANRSWYKERLYSSKPSERLDAVQYFALQRDDMSAEMLIDAAIDRDDDVRYFAVEALTRLLFDRVGDTSYILKTLANTIHDRNEKISAVARMAVEKWDEFSTVSAGRTR